MKNIILLLVSLFIVSCFVGCSDNSVNPVTKDIVKECKSKIIIFKHGVNIPDTCYSEYLHYSNGSLDLQECGLSYQIEDIKSIELIPIR